MKANYIVNNNNETINTIMQAIDFEKCDMLLALNSEAQKKQNAIVSSSESTPEEVTVAKTKLENLQKEELTLVTARTADADAHTLVLSTVTAATNEHNATNDVNALRNILRLSACDENSKFFKLAIITENINFATFYDTMVSLHDMESDEIGTNGLRSYSKTAKENANQMEVEIQGLIKKMFSIQVENDFTKKINVKFNKSDMNAVHETFVTGLSVDISKKVNKKTNETSTTVDGMSFRYAIERKQDRDGKITYNGVRFKETLAKIAFTKLFKVTK